MLEHSVGVQEEQPIALGRWAPASSWQPRPLGASNQSGAGGFGDDAGFVGRAAIDDDRLPHDVLDHGRHERGEDGRKRALGIKGGDNYRNHGADLDV